MKRVLTSCLVVLICLTAFFYGYGKGCYSYAETERRATNEELDAILYSYMQSRGGNTKSISQNGAAALLAKQQIDRYKVFNALFGQGSEFTREQFLEHVTVGKDEENGMYFNIDGIGAGFLNTKFSSMALNNTFGDNVSFDNDGMLDNENETDNELYNGMTYVDDNGYKCLVYIETNDPSGTGANYSNLIARGTPYLANWNEIKSGLSSVTSVINGVSRTITFSPYINNHGDFSYMNCIGANSFLIFNGQTGNPAIIYLQSTNKYYLGIFSENPSNNTWGGRCWWDLTFQENEEPKDVNVLFYTNNNLNITNYPDINADGSLYLQPKVNVGLNGEIDYRPYIINEGDTITNVINNYYQDTNTPDKTVTAPTTEVPSGDGGGGSSDNPSGGTPPDWSNNFPHLSPDGEGGFNFNFTLPDLNIDWNINGLTEKFPFSIPFDLIHFIQVLNAEPETPEFDWTIDLKIYQWHIDADLHQFDNLAGIVRNVEFIGFCITLVMITRRMIKG